MHTELVYRQPTMSDAQALTDFINKLSAENTFILFSGEKISLQEEKEYLSSCLEKIKKGDLVKISVFDGDALVGNATVERNTANKKRSLHTATLSIGLLKEYRGKGVGKKLAQTVLRQALSDISGLEIITLGVFGTNTAAQNLYKKLGFKEYGRVPGEILHKGEKIDHVYMYTRVENLTIL